MKKVSLIIILIFMSSICFADLNFKKENGKVEFKAKGWPSLLKIKGKGEGFKGDLKSKEGKLSGELRFNLNTLKTGIDLRDDHLKNKYLKVNNNPTALLVVENLDLPRKGRFEFKADLVLNGVSKTVKVKAKTSTKRESIIVKASFKIKLSDFKIEIPSFKGVTVAEDVEIQVTSKANLKVENE